MPSGSWHGRTLSLTHSAYTPFVLAANCMQFCIFDKHPGSTALDPQSGTVYFVRTSEGLQVRCVCTKELPTRIDWKGKPLVRGRVMSLCLKLVFFFWALCSPGQGHQSKKRSRSTLLVRVEDVLGKKNAPKKLRCFIQELSVGCMHYMHFYTRARYKNNTSMKEHCWCHACKLNSNTCDTKNDMKCA